MSANGITMTVSYSGGNGGTYNAQTVSSTGVTGLTATLVAGSFNNGSGNLIYQLSGISFNSGTAVFAINLGGQSCNVSINLNCGAFIAPGQWKTFMCHNLGVANTNADPFTPSWEINGGYWQWGRKNQAAAGPAGPSSSQANSGSISGWNTTDAPNGAWSDNFKTANDPCPTGFRVPTKDQWDGVSNNNNVYFVGTWSSSPTNYSSGQRLGNNLMLPAAGVRYSDNGSLDSRGSLGYYWSSSVSTTFAWYQYFTIVNVYTNNNLLRTNGLSVRCISE